MTDDRLSEDEERELARSFFRIKAARLRHLRSKATGGRWRTDRERALVDNVWLDGLPKGATPIEARAIDAALGLAIGGTARKEDAEFICAAHEDLPDLLDRYDALENLYRAVSENCSVPLPDGMMSFDVKLIDLEGNTFPAIAVNPHWLQNVRKALLQIPGRPSTTKKAT